MTADEFATMIYWWHGAPQDGSSPENPNRIKELLSAMETGPARAVDDVTGCRNAGIVTALEAAYPSSMKGWRQTHPDLALGVDRALEFLQKEPEWVGFLIAQWLINHKPELIDQMLDMIADGGDRGRYARYAVDKSAGQCVPFLRALRRARETRKQRMLIVQ